MLPAATGPAAVLTQEQLLCPGKNGGSQGLAGNLMDGLDTDHKLSPRRFDPFPTQQGGKQHSDLS